MSEYLTSNSGGCLNCKKKSNDGDSYDWTAFFLKAVSRLLCRKGDYKQNTSISSSWDDRK